MSYLAISTSLSPKSRSRIMLRAAYKQLLITNPDTQWLDLDELDLPACDGHAAYGHEGAQQLKAAVENADGILIGFGVYNYGPSAISKTVLELAGKSFSDKIVGFACAAGGSTSYMTGLALANSLMLDFRSVIVPRFVYATGAAFEKDQITDEDLTPRLTQLADELVRMTNALRG